MTFEEVLPLLKEGKLASREGWNGKGLTVAIQKGYPDGIKINKNTAEAWKLEEGDLLKVLPYFQIKDSKGVLQMWVPSTGDILASDWQV